MCNCFSNFNIVAAIIILIVVIVGFYNHHKSSIKIKKLEEGFAEFIHYKESLEKQVAKLRKENRRLKQKLRKA